MSDTELPTPPADDPDGSTNISEERKRYTERLGDGSPTGDATEDPRQDTDTASGGDPDDERDADAPTRPEDVDLATGTDPDGAPVENPSGG